MKYLNQITEIWQSKYEPHVSICTSISEVLPLLTRTRNDCTKIFGKKSDFVTFKKYYNHLIEHMLNHIQKELEKIFLEDAKENTDSSLSKNCETPKITKTLKINLTQFNLKNLENLKMNLLPANDSKVNENLKSNALLEIAHLLRCHSNQNNPNDNETEVNDAAFELNMPYRCSLDDSLTYTDLFATCGRNIINFIDAKSGKVLKRFTDDSFVKHKKEVKYKIKQSFVYDIKDFFINMTCIMDLISILYLFIDIHSFGMDTIKRLTISTDCRGQKWSNYFNFTKQKCLYRSSFCS